MEEGHGQREQYEMMRVMVNNLKVLYNHVYIYIYDMISEVQFIRLKRNESVCV